MVGIVNNISTHDNSLDVFYISSVPLPKEMVWNEKEEIAFFNS